LTNYGLTPMTEPKAGLNARPCHQIDLGLSGTCGEYSKGHLFPTIVAFWARKAINATAKYCLIAIFFSNSSAPCLLQGIPGQNRL
ncbi:hypothetical protein, partial [Pseudomonas cannabina]|uniref:hypothetical protein n=1 Tax=Pseudomonas cannabina TaxID=86840 RepID=UPI00227725AF